jgi:serine/threonine-protein kinase
MALDTGLLPERYVGVQLVGRGGMGEIYLATDTALGRAVAVKVLDDRYAQDLSVRERFKREALSAARLSAYPNIVTIYDVGEWRDRPFIVMEHLAGGSLEERIRADGPLPPRPVLDWLEQAANALDAAHREGVVHRDVKPANLLLDRYDRVRVADFGVASAAGMESLTQTGTVLGTAAYLAPEQAKGERATRASDGYALAVVAFELLTGRRPFEAESVAAEAAAHVTREVPSVRAVNRKLPCELDPVFERALAKDPAERFGSCAEFVAALHGALDEAAGSTAVLARPATAPTRVARRPPSAPPPPYRRRRSPWLPALVAMLFLAGIGGAVAGALLTRGGGGTAAPEPQRPSVSVRTVTARGTTVQQTVTAPASPSTTASAATTFSPATKAPSTPTAPPSSDPHTLNDRAFSLMNQGNFQAALPLLQQAVQALAGQTADIYAAYANYNLGVTLVQLGRCADAIPYLETAKRLEPNRHEVHDALKHAHECAK